MNNDNLLVKINYVAKDSDECINHAGVHINNSTNINSSKYLIAGGIYNKNRGALIFNARNIEEANQIIDNNKLINNGKYTFELLSKDSLLI